MFLSAACDFKRSQADRRKELAAIGSGVPAVSRAAPEPNAELRLRGEGLFFRRAGCAACHKVNQRGDATKCPNLGVGDGMTESVAVRGARRVGNLSAIEYIVTSIVDPNAYVVSGYKPGVVKKLDEPPTSLSDDEIVALAAYLAGLSNTPVTDMDVVRAHNRIEIARRLREQRLAAKRKPQSKR